LLTWTRKFRNSLTGTSGTEYNEAALPARRAKNIF
jgi:hypothetical protein